MNYYLVYGFFKVGNDFSEPYEGDIRVDDSDPNNPIAYLFIGGNWVYFCGKDCILSAEILE